MKKSTKQREAHTNKSTPEFDLLFCSSRRGRKSISISFDRGLSSTTLIDYICTITVKYTGKLPPNQNHSSELTTFFKGETVNNVDVLYTVHKAYSSINQVATQNSGILSPLLLQERLFWQRTAQEWVHWQDHF